MTTKHTKGPWIYEKPRADFDQNLGYVVGPNDISKGMVVTGACPANPLNEANARLIAAAPTMLETLENTLEVIENLLEKVLPQDEKQREIFLNDSDNDEFLQLTGTLSDINNAIDKAKG